MGQPWANYYVMGQHRVCLSSKACGRVLRRKCRRRRRSCVADTPGRHAGGPGLRLPLQAIPNMMLAELARSYLHRVVDQRRRPAAAVLLRRISTAARGPPRQGARCSRSPPAAARQIPPSPAQSVSPVWASREAWISQGLVHQCILRRQILRLGSTISTTQIVGSKPSILSVRVPGCSAAGTAAGAAAAASHAADRGAAVAMYR